MANPKQTHIKTCKTCNENSANLIKGMCKRCYDAARYIKHPRQKHIVICSICKEKNTHLVKGMCQRCYDASRYTKHPLQKHIVMCSRCKEKKIHHARGMCQNCYNRWHDHNILGKNPYNLDTTCTMYLGVHVAERILSNVFKNVTRMPMNNPGYDFVCSKDMKIDVKSACLTKSNGKKVQWMFNIHHNTIPDYFLCIAFDNRNTLIPMHLWLIPGNLINTQTTASISISTINKWNKYKLSLTKIIDFCNEIKTQNEAI